MVVAGVSLSSMRQVSDTKPEFVIDGRRITSLESFFEEFSRAVLPVHRVRQSLDAFNDVLRGGFGTPEGGFTVRWRHSAISREKLGYPETVRQYEKMLKTCHPDNVPSVWVNLTNAQSGIGETVFDWIVKIIRDHGPGGEEEEDNVSLVLE
jgi:RNAse (barnase) inhibitor barstar